VGKAFRELPTENITVDIHCVMTNNARPFRTEFESAPEVKCSTEKGDHHACARVSRPAFAEPPGIPQARSHGRSCECWDVPARRQPRGLRGRPPQPSEAWRCGDASAGAAVSMPLAPLTDPTTGLTFPDLDAPPFGGEDFSTNLIMPEPCPFLSRNLPTCSVI